MKARNNISGIILAGGKSSRMGTDKGLILLKNKPFVEHIIHALKPVVSEIIIVSNNEVYDKFNTIRIDDLIQDAGPLAGLYTGLMHSQNNFNFVLSCDIPCISTPVLEFLLDAANPEYEIVQGQYQNESLPLIGLYQKKCLYKIKELLNQGEKRLRALAEHCTTYDLEFLDGHERSIRNINSIKELNTLLNEIES